MQNIMRTLLLFSILTVLSNCKTAQTITTPAGTNPIVTLDLKGGDLTFGELVTGEAKYNITFGFLTGNSDKRGHLMGYSWTGSEGPLVLNPQDPCPEAMFNALAKAPDADFLMAPRVEVTINDKFFTKEVICKISGRAAKYK